MKMDKRQEFIDKPKKTDDEIDEEFSNLIREQLDDKQFNEWAMSWLDGDDICSRAEEWDIYTKRQEIIRIKKEFLK